MGRLQQTPGSDAPRRAREKRTVEAMIRLYCRDLHRAGGDGLCEACETLRAYAAKRLDACRFGADKPKCSACPVHCYKPAMREQIRAVMKYAGPRMAVRHPLLAVGHLVDGILHKPQDGG